MEEAELIALAHAAGLQKALADFPEDVVAAAGAAAKARGDFSAPADGTSEPLPPMRMLVEP